MLSSYRNYSSKGIQATGLQICRMLQKKSGSISKDDFSKIISSLPLVELFQNIMQKTSFGWDQVTQSLVQLGIILIDLASPSGKISGENIIL